MDKAYLEAENRHLRREVDALRGLLLSARKHRHWLKLRLRRLLDWFFSKAPSSQKRLNPKMWLDTTEYADRIESEIREEPEFTTGAK